MFYCSEHSYIGGSNFLGLDSRWVGISALPRSLASDVSAVEDQMELAEGPLFRFQSNLSSPYLGTCFTSRLVEFVGSIWPNLSSSYRLAATVTQFPVLSQV